LAVEGRILGERSMSRNWTGMIVDVMGIQSYGELKQSTEYRVNWRLSQP